MPSWLQKLLAISFADTATRIITCCAVVIFLCAAIITVAHSFGFVILPDR